MTQDIGYTPLRNATEEQGSHMGPISLTEENKINTGHNKVENVALIAHKVFLLFDHDLVLTQHSPVETKLSKDLLKNYPYIVLKSKTSHKDAGQKLIKILHFVHKKASLSEYCEVCSETVNILLMPSLNLSIPHLFSIAISSSSISKSFTTSGKSVGGSAI